jgi:hypothetical protein
VLRSWVPGVRRWIPLTALAFGLVHAFNDALPYRPLDIPVVLAADGVVLGALQWFALRRALPRSWVWLPAATIGWLAGGLVSTTLLAQGASDPLVEIFVGWGSAGVVMGLITGTVLLRQLSPKQATTRDAVMSDGNDPSIPLLCRRAKVPRRVLLAAAWSRSEPQDRNS